MPNCLAQSRERSALLGQIRQGEHGLPVLRGVEEIVLGRHHKGVVIVLAPPKGCVPSSCHWRSSRDSGNSSATVAYPSGAGPKREEPRRAASWEDGA
jgi:hypothetical protein